MAKIAAIVLVAVVLLIGGVAYAFLKPPPTASGPIQAIPLATGDAADAPAVATATVPTTVAGSGTTTYTIDQSGSQARFVIDETLRGAPFTVMGATNQVAGQIAVDPAAPGTARIGTTRINARAFATESTQRDRAIQNQVLQTEQYEYITFVPTALVGLPERASSDEAVTFQIVGQLTIRGTTREATFDATVTPVADGRLQGRATGTIRYADFAIGIPQVPFVADVSEQVRLELDFVATAS